MILRISFNPQQCRAARALLEWTQQDLRLASGVSQKTIADFELGLRQPFPHTLYALREALEMAGVEFIDAQEGQRGSGVMLTWETELRKRDGQAKENENEGNAGESGSKAIDPGLVSYWRARPELWQSLSQTGRRILSIEMFGYAYMAEELLPPD